MFERVNQPIPDQREPTKETLADMAAVELLDVLETPIGGKQSVQILDYDNARRLVKVALLATFEAATKGV